MPGILRQVVILVCEKHSVAESKWTRPAIYESKHACWKPYGGRCEGKSMIDYM